MRRPINFKELIKHDKEFKKVLEFYCNRKDYATIFELILGRIVAEVVEEGNPVNLKFFILEAYRKKWKSGIVGEEIDTILLRLRSTKAFKDYIKELLAKSEQEGGSDEG